jgi:hypothetical protein
MQRAYECNFGSLAKNFWRICECEEYNIFAVSYYSTAMGGLHYRLQGTVQAFVPYNDFMTTIGYGRSGRSPNADSKPNAHSFANISLHYSSELE